MTDTTSSNIQLVQDTYAAFGRGDMDAVIAAMHPDIDWHEAFCEVLGREIVTGLLGRHSACA